MKKLILDIGYVGKENINLQDNAWPMLPPLSGSSSSEETVCDTSTLYKFSG